MLPISSKKLPKENYVNSQSDYENKQSQSISTSAHKVSLNLPPSTLTLKKATQLSKKLEYRFRGRNLGNIEAQFRLLAALPPTNLATNEKHTVFKINNKLPRLQINTEEKQKRLKKTIELFQREREEEAKRKAERDKRLLKKIQILKEQDKLKKILNEENDKVVSEPIVDKNGIESNEKEYKNNEVDSIKRLKVQGIEQKRFNLRVAEKNKNSEEITNKTLETEKFNDFNDEDDDDEIDQEEIIKSLPNTEKEIDKDFQIMMEGGRKYYLKQKHLTDKQKQELKSRKWLTKCREEEEVLCNKLRKRVLQHTTLASDYTKEGTQYIALADPFQRKTMVVEKALRWVPPEQYKSGAMGGSWRSCMTCELCLLPANWNIVHCAYCNVVVHEACLMKQLLTPCKDEYDTIDDLMDKSQQIKYNLKNGYICQECDEYIEDSKETYTVNVAIKQEKEVQKACQIRVATKFRCHIKRKQFRAKRNAIILLQQHWRTLIMKRDLNNIRKAIIRPMMIKINWCKNLPIVDEETRSSDTYVVLEIIRSNGQQIYRIETPIKYETLNPIYDEYLIIPGIAGDCSLVFTVIAETNKTDGVVGQTFIKLDNTACVNKIPINAWKVGGTFDLELKDAIIPVREDKHPHNVQRYDYHSIETNGSVNVTFQPFLGLGDFCGYLWAPQIELLKEDPYTAANRQRKVWVALMGGKLYIYKGHGELKPKMVIDLRRKSLFSTSFDVENTSPRANYTSNFLSKHQKTDPTIYHKADQLVWARDRKTNQLYFKINYIPLPLKFTIYEQKQCDRWITAIEFIRRKHKEKPVEVMRQLAKEIF